MDSLAKITDDQINELENSINQLDAQLANLSCFILPGGHQTTAWAHIYQTVCRRTARNATRISAEYGESQAAQQYQMVLVYLKKLIDYLFEVARYCNHTQEVADTLWK